MLPTGVRSPPSLRTLVLVPLLVLRWVPAVAAPPPTADQPPPTKAAALPPKDEAKLMKALQKGNQYYKQSQQFPERARELCNRAHDTLKPAVDRIFSLQTSLGTGVWPPAALTALYTLGVVGYRLLRLGSRVLGEDGNLTALVAFEALALHSPESAMPLALEWQARTLAGIGRDCLAVDVYEGLLLRKPDITQWEEDSGPLFAASAGACNPPRGVELWLELLRLGRLHPSNATQCRSCWNKFHLALRRSGRAEEAERHFAEELRPHVPWRHAQQMPLLFNTHLATSIPQPWLNHSDHQLRPCIQLADHRKEILEEFATYTAGVEAGTTQDLFTPDHEDTGLVAGAAASWRYLHLKRVVGDSGWDEETCRKFFPRTCAAIRGLREVDRQLKDLQPADGPGCEGWCSHQDSPGVVAFYWLEPGASVPLHTGPSNQRLKCQLAVAADAEAIPGGPGYSWTEVGGERRSVGLGDVLAFDDSYAHAVHNGGGVNGSAARVVLDVAFWHPTLWSASPPAAPTVVTPTRPPTANSRAEL